MEADDEDDVAARAESEAGKAAKGAGGAKQPAVVGSAVATPEARPHKCNICGGAFKRLGALT